MGRPCDFQRHGSDTVRGEDFKYHDGLAQTPRLNQVKQLLGFRGETRAQTHLNPNLVEEARPARAGYVGNATPPLCTESVSSSPARSVSTLRKSRQVRLRTADYVSLRCGWDRSPSGTCSDFMRASSRIWAEAGLRPASSFRGLDEHFKV
ncbi:uncharacterized protein VTP21DRAFT_11368 [Calcarisporiella thermophila]|uniref:uncharacterized protein n=1 Tax=Calcarisporiella thermophila TaxID=911321 RepID=UPI00374468D5